MHRPQENGQVVTMMRTTVSTQPQIIIVACCITLRRSAYDTAGNYSVHDDKGAKNTSATFIGHINPLRYRGYYYDRETRLYYLQSRYYDFANCRFINNVPNSMLSQLYTGGVDTSIFRSGTLTVYGDQLVRLLVSLLAQFLVRFHLHCRVAINRKLWRVL